MSHNFAQIRLEIGQKLADFWLKKARRALRLWIQAGGLLGLVQGPAHH